MELRAGQSGPRWPCENRGRVAIPRRNHRDRSSVTVVAGVSRASSLQPTRLPLQCTARATLHLQSRHSKRLACQSSHHVPSANEGRSRPEAAGRNSRPTDSPVRFSRRHSRGCAGRRNLLRCTACWRSDQGVAVASARAGGVRSDRSKKME